MAVDNLAVTFKAFIMKLETTINRALVAFKSESELAEFGSSFMKLELDENLLEVAHGVLELHDISEQDKQSLSQLPKSLSIHSFYHFHMSPFYSLKALSYF